MSFMETLYEELEARLRDVALVAENALLKAEQSLQITKAVLQQLKAYVLENDFANLQEEIAFFKQVKPKFHRHLIFFRELFSFEEKRPVGGKEALISYYREVITRISLFFSRHERLYNYYRLNRTEEDQHLFVRVNGKEDESPEFDNRYCTAASFELSKILAFEEFLQLLTTQLHSLEQGALPAVTVQEQKSGHLLWTDSKVALIELVYALQSSGSINHGKISVAQLMSIMSAFLGIEVGNYYAVFQQNIRIRKKRRTVYLHFLAESLEARMDESDENPRYK